MRKNDWGVHESHCCYSHGCKYGDANCPVADGSTKQDYRCEWCIEDDEYDANDVKEMFEITYESPACFQWSDDFIFRNYDDAKKFLTSKGFRKASNGFVSDWDSMRRAYITPKKIY